MSSYDPLHVNMSQLLVDCQLNITRLLCQVEGVLCKQQKKLKESCINVAKKLNLNSTPVVKQCERQDLEINLTVSNDTKGTLLIPSGIYGSFTEENNNTYVISPIPTPKRLKLTTKVQVKGVLLKTPKQSKSRKCIIPDISTSELSTTKEMNASFAADCGGPGFLMEPEIARLDFKEMSNPGFQLDPIQCEVDVKCTPKRQYDNLSSCDSGYDNSDLEENICHSPRSVASITTDYSEGKSDDNRCFSPKSLFCEINDILDEEVNIATSISDQVESDPTKIHQNNESTPKHEQCISLNNSMKNSTPGNAHTLFRAYTDNPCLPTPIQFKKSSDFSLSSENEKFMQLNTSNIPFIQKLDCDMTGFSYSGSFDSQSDANVTFYTNTKDLSSSLDGTDLQSEITQALRQSLLEEEGYNEEDEGEISLLMPTSISISSEVLCEEMKICEEHLLGEVDRRQDELHNMVDQWHKWIKQQIQSAYQNEEDRMKRESKKILPVQGVRSPTKTMYTFLNTKEKLSHHAFGTFNTNITNLENVPGAGTKRNNYFLTGTKHIRTFESRDTELNTDYMATGLSYEDNCTFTVTDLGADTCRIFTQSGKLIKDLDVSPLDEPSYGLSVDNGHTILACRSGLKFYTPDSQFSRSLAPQDIKCPQCVATDSVGNYIISDMHDCGSVIVTLERNTLLPLRMFCGTQYDDHPQSFRSAWYIYVTRSNNIILSDRDDHMIKAYSPHGEYLWSAGGLGAQPGKFFTPAGISEDRLGNILVADCNNDRVQVFSSSGKWLGIVVSNDMFEDIKSPTDLAITSDGHIAVLLASGTVCLYSYLQS